jgi:hypothetical protein
VCYRFELYLPAGNYTIRARVADASGAITIVSSIIAVSVIRPAGATDAAVLTAFTSLASRLDRLSRAPQLMLLSATMADELNAGAAAGAAAAEGSSVGTRRLTGSSAGYREQVRV